MTFTEIDQRRAALGIEQKTLAERAGLTAQAYTRLKKPIPRGPTERTVQRLETALNALEAEREASKP